MLFKHEKFCKSQMNGESGLTRPVTPYASKRIVSGSFSGNIDLGFHLGN